jgi:hypothetical protein
VVITPPGPAQRYYPQQGPVSVRPDGSFEGIAYYGDTTPASIGTYQLRVALANHSAADQFRAYLASGSGGLSPLPLGAQILDTVKVSRRY